MPLPEEEKAMKGICPDCGKPLKAWTWAEIQEAKADIGMGDEDDFCAVCDECGKKYFGCGANDDDRKAALERFAHEQNPQEAA